MNLCRSRGLFSYSTFLLLTLLFNRKIAAKRCIHDFDRILTDLVKEGENLLNFNYQKYPPKSVLEHITSFIKERKQTRINEHDVIYNLLAFNKILQRSTQYIENIIKSGDNGGKNPCAEVLQLCDLEISDEQKQNTYAITNIIDYWNRYNFNQFDKLISPLSLTEEPLDKILSMYYDYKNSKKVPLEEANNAGNAVQQENEDGDIYSYQNETEYFEEMFSATIVRITTLLHCEVKKLDTHRTTFHFYIFTLSENGYPRFIVKPMTFNGENLFYVISELLAEDEASSSTPYVKEEESE